MGFTVIELLVVMALGAMLITLADISMVYMIQSNRVTSRVNLLTSSLRLARSEAMRRGLPVVVCISSSGTACDTSGADWSKGWITYVDTDGNAALDSGESVVRVQPALTGPGSSTASGSTRAVAFSRDGFGLNLSGKVVWTLSDTGGSSTVTQCASLTVVGVVAESAPTNGACS